jgi:hypothetical protein
MHKQAFKALALLPVIQNPSFHTKPNIEDRQLTLSSNARLCLFVQKGANRAKFKTVRSFIMSILFS